MIGHEGGWCWGGEDVTYPGVVEFGLDGGEVAFSLEYVAQNAELGRL